MSLFSIRGGSHDRGFRDNIGHEQTPRRREQSMHERMHLKMLESNLAKALMINQALWELLSEKTGLTEDDLNNKLYEIDMRDGKLDGKNQRSEPTKCPNCARPVSPKHAACIYCGQVLSDSVFDMTK